MVRTTKAMKAMSSKVKGKVAVPLTQAVETRSYKINHKKKTYT